MNYTKLFIGIFIFASCKAQPPLQTNTDDNTLLWEISGNKLKSPSYLFGTFHLLCKSDMPIGQQLKTAIKQSSKMYMELDMDDPATMMGGLLLMNMRGDTTLKDLFSEMEYNKVAAFFKDSLSMPITFFKSMKPLFLMSMLYPKMLPCKTITGVEAELMQMAKTQKQEILGLETMAFQSSVFDSIPYKQQANELLKIIDSLPAAKKYFDTMVKVYKNQQLAKMQQLLNNSDFGMEDNQDILLDKRNANWVLQLKKIMPAQPVFIAVGAGHLVGDKGLITLLRKEGYTVRPLKN